MSYIALYRKYRSQNFDELMGQEAVTTTLQNAIRTGRIAHAYLFHGARGCGKTSTARLLSRALNCVAQDGPSPEPCGVCRLCVSIREGTCMDVVEIDAASETGVDNVREKIIENVQYANSEARYKVYIIDEVHDLSAKAFDALLKTLEEPPPHVVFILATTEYHKVPITIRSRCQGYQFKRGSLHDLSASIERVILAEGFTAEAEAVQAVARSAEGSWRDALSILEQVLAYSDGHITAEIVHRALGTVGTEMLARVTETLSAGAWDETLGIASDLVDSGTDVRQLLTALTGHLRDLMLLATGAKQAAAQELGADKLNLLKSQANLFAPASLLEMMGELSAAERECRTSNQHRWILERTLVRLMLIGQGTLVAEPQPRPAARPQEKAVSPTPRPQAQTAVANGKSSQPFHTDDAELPSRANVAASPTNVPRPPTQETAQALASASVYASPAASPAADTELDNEDNEADEEEADALEAEPDEVLAPPPLTITAAPLVEESVPGVEMKATFNASNPASNGHAAPAAPSSDRNRHQFAEGVTLEVIQRAWPRVLKLVEKEGPAGIPWLKQATVTGLDGNHVLLTFKDVFARDRINKPKGRELLDRKLNEALQTTGYRIQCVLEAPANLGTPQNTLSSPGSDTQITATGKAAPIEMGTLLDSPPTPSAPSGPTRVMDYEVPSAAPPPTAYAPPASSNGSSNGSSAAHSLDYANGSNGANNSVADNASNAAAVSSPAPAGNGSTATSNGAANVTARVATPEPAPETDPSVGMLREVLDIFGGQVVSTENNRIV